MKTKTITLKKKSLLKEHKELVRKDKQIAKHKTLTKGDKKWLKAEARDQGREIKEFK
jgi:hypothetical protein